MRRNPTAQVVTTTIKPTTRTKIETGEITNGDTRIQEEQGQEDYKNRQPDSLEQKLEAMMAPTATADAHPSEEQAERRKRSIITIMPISANQNAAKNNAEETKQTKQIKHANQVQEPRRQKKTENQNNTLDSSTIRGRYWFSRIQPGNGNMGMPI